MVLDGRLLGWWWWWCVYVYVWVGVCVFVQGVCEDQGLDRSLAAVQGLRGTSSFPQPIVSCLDVHM